MIRKLQEGGARSLAALGLWAVLAPEALVSQALAAEASASKASASKAPASKASAVIGVVGEAGGCPSAERVAAELRAAQPARRVSVGAEPFGLAVRLWDGGDRYAVMVGAVRRELADPHRDCAERARAAAVVVALAIEAAPGVPEQYLAAARMRLRVPRWRLELELGGGVEGALGSDGGALVGAGPALGLVVARGPWAARVGLGLVSPADLDLGAARARIWRAPFDLAARATRPFGERRRFELFGELGLGWTLLSIAGAGLAASSDSARLEFGFRAAVGARLLVSSRWALFARVPFTFVPSPFELALRPDGVVGSTPRARLGFLLGAAARLGSGGSAP